MASCRQRDLIAKSTSGFHGSLSLLAFAKIHGAAAIARVILWGYGRFILVVIAVLLMIGLISYSMPMVGKLLMYFSK